MKEKEEKKEEKIIIKGARMHNLKNISLEIPRNKLVVFTGLSGSGKSSLAFDTIFAEGQRRFVESLSSYARQFLRQMPKPDVDEISGLSPAISIDQKSRSNNPRSTVATITEIYDYLRVLFARIGKPHCLICDEPIEKLSLEEIVNFVLENVRNFPAEKKKVMAVAFEEGEAQVLSPVVRGRKGEYYQLLYDMLGRGFEKVRIDNQWFSLRERILIDKNKKHNIDFLADTLSFNELKSKEGRSRLQEAIEKALALADGVVKIVLKSKNKEEEFIYSSRFACKNDGFSYPEIEPRLFSWNSPYGACPECHGLGTHHLFGSELCPVCKGFRLRPEALSVYLPGTKTNIINFIALSAEGASQFLEKLKLSPKEIEISQILLKEIKNRLQFLINVGLEYLTLDRRANTLSGGEAQRIRLASQLGARLVGALYVLDEPTIGLHEADTERLIKTLTDLRDLGNTVIVVEHDEAVIYSADYLVDFGPGAGVYGGQVVVADYLDKLLTAKKNFGSRTLAYLRGEETIKTSEKRRKTDKGSLKITGGRIFNIKNLNIEVPLGKFVCITGVSGSGKSSFLYEILHKNLQARFERKYRSNETFNCQSFLGTEYLNRAILLDQSPIGRTPRSNIATYTGVFTFIRDIFAEAAEARVRGYTESRFSFNVPAERGGGRCEACEGNGEIAVEMHFLPTIYVTCDVCGGKRFDQETLAVKYKNKNIFDCLEMTVAEALEFWQDIPAITDRLQALVDVGLSYLKLGQTAKALSGGESERLKIASELFRPFLTKTIYLLDEPTVGLHYDDVVKLLLVLDRLVKRGNSVVVIEHNLHFIKNADYILDFGPRGGEEGGQIVAKGTPEEVANNPKSLTGKYLKKVLKI